MIVKLILSTTCVTGIVLGSAFAQAPQQAAAAPADGITMDMMPITQDQLTQCRQQASGQLSDEQKTLHDREHGQDKDKMAQGDDMFRQRRSLFFKKMQIVRGCDVKRNVLVYMVYSDKIIEGSPKNSTSTVPVMPWGAGDTIEKCADWVE